MNNKLYFSVVGHDFQDKIKERLDYSQIQHVSYSKKKNEFTIKPAVGDAVTYLCEDRDALLSRIHRAMDISNKSRGIQFAVERLGRIEVKDKKKTEKWTNSVADFKCAYMDLFKHDYENRCNRS